jgi:plasmid maintenance system killer protein
MLWPAVTRKLTQLNRVLELRELAIPLGNRLEALRGTRRGRHSIRTNDQFRICFRWEDGYADDVKVTDYHEPAAGAGAAAPAHASPAHASR